MAIKKIGDWEKVTLLISNLDNEMQKARSLALKRFAAKAEGIAKSHMSAQDLNWVRLEPETIAAKVRRGESEHTLIATSDYFQAVESWTDDNKGIAYAGVKKDIRNDDGEVIASIAAIHEYGIGVPERPLWRPTFDETIRWFTKSDSTPTKIFAKNIQKYK